MLDQPPRVPRANGKTGGKDKKKKELFCFYSDLVERFLMDTFSFDFFSFLLSTQVTNHEKKIIILFSFIFSLISPVLCKHLSMGDNEAITYHGSWQTKGELLWKCGRWKATTSITLMTFGIWIAITIYTWKTIKVEPYLYLNNTYFLTIYIYQDGYCLLSQNTLVEHILHNFANNTILETTNIILIMYIVK